MMVKLVADRGQALVIVSFWPSQAWFPLFADSIESTVYWFDISANTLSLPFRTSDEKTGHRRQPHPLTGHTQLLAATCSARPCSGTVSRRPRPTSSRPLGAPRRQTSTRRTAVDGPSFVVRGVLTRAEALSAKVSSF